MKHDGGKKFIQQAQGIHLDVAFCEMPFYLRSRANGRGNWQLQASRAKECRAIGQWAATLCLEQGVKHLHWTPEKSHWQVQMVRFSRRLLDSDNLVYSFKSVRDGIADVLGQDDRWNGGIEWFCDQKTSKEYGIRIELKRLSPT